MAGIDGTSNNDFLFGTEQDDTLRGFGGDDLLSGIGGDDFLDGGDDADTLVGGDGDDMLIGGNGNDRLAGDFDFGIKGADTLTGGAGGDRFEFSLFSGGTDPIVQDRVTDFEGAGVAGGDRLELQSGFGADTRLTFGGRLAAMPLLGGSIGTGGDGLAAIFYALSGGDTFVLADSNDDGVYDAADFTVRLAGGHDLIQSDFGGTDFVIAGSDRGETIDGTEGDDTILALGGHDTVNGRGGNDVIEGGNGHDSLNGDAGNDRIEGGRGNDSLSGGAGRDQLTGEAGNDVIDGGDGSDTVLAGGDGNDRVSGGAGNDTLDGDDGNDALFGGTGNDTLFGLDGNDSLFGEDGRDELFGGQGVDILAGGAGDDEIEGEEGADRVDGGAGDDQLNFFTSAFQPDSTFAGRDLVADFEGAGAAGGDQIRLSGGEFAFVGEIGINPRLGARLPGGGDGITQLGYVQHDGSAYLIADTNDDGRLDANDFTVEFAGLLDFTADDFTNTDFVVAGTNGDDVITGTGDGDRIFAAGGDDQVFGLGGDDEIHGGTGDDVLDGGPGGFDTLLGEDGNDRLTLASSDAGGMASGGAGNDMLFGSDASFGPFDNSLQGDAGDDELHAGAVGSSMNGGAGADRLLGGAADDQLTGGRDELSFALDGAQDLFVYGGSAWGSDILFDFEDGVDLFDLRGSGLAFEDLTITNGEFETRITSEFGTITIFESFGEPVEISAADFLFG